MRILGISILLPILLSFAMAQSGNSSENLRNRLADFVGVYNKNDPAELRRFVEQHFVKGINIDAEVLRWQKWQSVYGKISFHSEVFSESERLRAFYKGDLTKAWVELTIFASPSEKDLIRRIAVGSGLRPVIYETETLRSEKDLIETVEKYAASLTREDFFSGSILIARGDRILLKKGFGYADKSAGALNDSETKFSVASITKLFTALAIFQLKERGKISLDDPLSKFLPGYPNSEGIKIKHLLTHSSGLGRGDFDKAIFPMSDLSMDELVKLTYAEPEFEPGEAVGYSNGAYILLGKIVEIASGENYYEFVRKNIFKKAEMLGSDFFETDEVVPNRALGYSYAKFKNPQEVETFVSGERRNTILLNGFKGSPAGLSYSSVTDLFKFYSALRHDVFLSRVNAKLFMEKQVDIPAEDPNSRIKYSYGFGWEIDNIGGNTVIRKDGGTWGCSARLLIIPDSDFVVVVLSNYDSTGLVVSDHITDLILGMSK